MKIYPSLMCADLLNLSKVISNFDSVCDGYHIDVMDDHFVPNLTWGSDFINAIVKATKLPLLVHLMVDNPSSWPERLRLRDDDVFIFHYEVFECFEPIRNLINVVRSNGWKVGVAFNPETDWTLFKSEISNIDVVLVMAVHPGFAGQKFIPKVIDKIKELDDFRRTQKMEFKICVDGGVSKKNIKELVSIGADAFSVGSAIFLEESPLKALKDLYRVADRK